MVGLNSMPSRARRSEFLGEVWRLAARLDLSVEEVLAALSTESDRLVQRLLRQPEPGRSAQPVTDIYLDAAFEERTDDDIEFICSVCLFVRPRPGLDEDSLAETTLLTVVNGQMVCVRHAQCAGSTRHETIASGVFLESHGAMKGLSEYQDWRRRQDQESVVG